MKKTVLVALAAVVALALGAKAQASETATVNSNKSACVSSGTPEADKEISRKILIALVRLDADHANAYRDIKIVSVNGQVTLKGRIKNDKLKSTVHMAAVSVVGADNVTDQIVAKK
jgi:osmotically-inducible protein OsmY